MVRKNRKRINKASASVMRSFIWMIWMRLQLPYACQKTYRPGCTIWQSPPMTTSVSTGVSISKRMPSSVYFQEDRIFPTDVRGLERFVPAGTAVEITRGNSMTIYPGLYHEFSPKPGRGDLIIGGVSSINDDRTDNYFEVKRPRFIPVEEDCPAEILLCNEYGRLD